MATDGMVLRFTCAKLPECIHQALVYSMYERGGNHFLTSLGYAVTILTIHYIHQGCKSLDHLF